MGLVSAVGFYLWPGVEGTGKHSYGGEGPLGVTAKRPKQETTPENIRQAGVQTGHCRGTRFDGEELDVGVLVSVCGRETTLRSQTTC